VWLKSLGGTIENSGSLMARDADGSGGDIKIAAEGETPSAVVNSGALDVSATTTNATGGNVTVTAETISLSDGTRIDASGDAGGGQVFIGGGFQGSNPEIFNTQQTSVDHDVTISADALTEGDGGEVIVWADGRTSFEGTISARGGAVSGDGGFVEVSGKELLSYHGLTDTRAPSGQWGTLLLDPTTIQISDIYEDGTVGDTDCWNPKTISSNLYLGNVHLLADESLFVEAHGLLHCISWIVSIGNVTACPCSLILKRVHSGEVVCQEYYQVEYWGLREKYTICLTLQALSLRRTPGPVPIPFLLRSCPVVLFEVCVHD
jgi:hypothetical protein